MSGETAQTALCVFAKEPIEGEVKTRLAATLGTVNATRLAQAFLTDTLELAVRLRSTKVILAWSGDRARAPSIDGRVEVWPQGDGDLGQRLERTLSRALTRHAATIAIGTDCPHLPVGLLEQGVTALRAHDAVLGPADDGGFYLLGLRQCPPGLLHDLRWSASDTGAQTLARLSDRGLRVTQLAPCFDIDTEADLARLRAMIMRGEVSAPATERTVLELTA